MTTMATKTNTKVPKPAYSKTEPHPSKPLQKGNTNSDNKSRTENSTTLSKNPQNHGQNMQKQGKPGNQVRKGETILSQSVNLSRSNQRGNKPNSLSKSVPNGVSQLKGQQNTSKTKQNQPKQTEISNNLPKSVNSIPKNDQRSSRHANPVVSKSSPSAVNQIKAHTQQKQEVRLNKPQSDGQLTKTTTVQRPGPQQTGLKSTQQTGQKIGHQSKQQIGNIVENTSIPKQGLSTSKQQNNRNNKQFGQKQQQTISKEAGQIGQKPGYQVNGNTKQLLKDKINRTQQNIAKPLQNVQSKGQSLGNQQLNTQTGQRSLQAKGLLNQNTGDQNTNAQPATAQKNQIGRQGIVKQPNQQKNSQTIDGKATIIQANGNERYQNNADTISGLRGGANSTIQRQGLQTKGEQQKRSIKRGPGDKDKKRKKQMQRKVPEMPKIIENPAGVTSITLPELQLLLDEIEEMKGDKEYDGLTGFLSQLLQKVQNWDSGNYTRTEIELFVRQFQDFNEGFHYRMDQKPRGHALILTNYKFYKVPGDPWSYDFSDRPGAEIDADKMESLLKEMGYLVTRRDNIKHWEMEWELKSMAELDHRKFDSFICIMSSHGTINQVYGCDGLRILLNKQIRMFKGEKCSSLAGKPKLFFLQSCQAEEKEEQIPRTESTVLDSKPKPGELEKSRFLINDVDFLVGYSTLPGHLSYRHEQTGSWYLNALHDNIKENGDKYDIVTVLEDVNFDVSSKTEQYNYLNSSQVSMFSSTLRGPVFFH